MFTIDDMMSIGCSNVGLKTMHVNCSSYHIDSSGFLNAARCSAFKLRFCELEEL